MSIKHSLLSLSYLPLRARHSVSNIFNAGKKNRRLRVMLCHDIAPDKYGVFRKKIEWLSKRWNFINADEFVELLSGKKEITQDSLLLTFDDGFNSDRIVADEILNPIGIKALFFVISDFVELEDKNEQAKFIKNNLYPPSSGEDLPSHIADIRNMSINDLKHLVENGHTIGSHTATHARLSEIRDEQKLINEIVLSADRLEELIGVKINHFSFTFGNLASFSKQALGVARNRFPYIYTGMRGDNSLHVPSWAIRRDTIAVKDSLHLVGAFLEGAVDFRYRESLEKYESWGRGE